MGIPLRVIDGPLDDRAQYEPGMMWRDPTGDVEGRQCWVIILPGDSGGWPNFWSTTTGYGQGPGMWDVTGDPPNITVSPSIFCDPPRGWHGWIRNGELVDA